jgi:hypothetical protein
MSYRTRLLHHQRCFKYFRVSSAPITLDTNPTTIYLDLENPSNMSYMSVAMRPWISVKSWGLDRIDIIGIGTDNQMYRKSFDRDDGG